MLTHDGLKRDVARRITRIQAMMRDQDIGALILAGHASPSGMGAIRYITHAHLWGGVGYAILGVDDPHPWLQIWSSYQAVWSRNETTTLKERVECPADVVARTAELAMEYVGGSGRIGMVNMDKLMSLGTARQFEAALAGCELVEVTNEFNVIRQIKTPFELEAMQQNGAILDAAMDVFAEYAAPGVRYWDACAEVERYIKSFGAFWGRTKLSTNLSPETVPTDKDQRISEDDIINGYLTRSMLFRSRQDRQHPGHDCRCQRRGHAQPGLRGGGQTHAGLSQHRPGWQRWTRRRRTLS